MLSRKVSEAMILSSNSGGNYKAVCVLSRMKLLVTVVLKYSETPKADLLDFGFLYDRKCIKIIVKRLSKVILMPAKIMIENMVREKFVEINLSTLEGASEWRYFSLPDTIEARNLISLFDNPKFIAESQYYKLINESDKAQVIKKKDELHNSKLYTVIMDNLTFTSKFDEKNPQNSSEANPYFIYVNKNINLPKENIITASGKNPFLNFSNSKKEQKNKETIFITDPNSTWMSTLAVKKGSEELIPSKIEP